MIGNVGDMNNDERDKIIATDPRPPTTIAVTTMTMTLMMMR